MKIVCNRDKLNEAIAIVSRAVATKSNLASIEGILLIAENDTLTLTGYDFEMGIKTTFECEVEIRPHVCSFALYSLGRASLGCAGNPMGCRCVLLSKVHREELRRGGITQSFAQALANPAALPPELSSALLWGCFPFVQSASSSSSFEVVLAPTLSYFV